MNNYKVLKQQSYTFGDYSIVPVREEDRYDIMKWRNEQMYHLRQNEILTKEMQDDYFNNVVSKLFEQDKPSQILFSYLKGEECIGYGGLVHINWVDKNAEISFVLNTKLDSDNFKAEWKNYLILIEEVAKKEIGFHKIFTYAFDLRPKLYDALEKNGYYKEAVLKNHCFYNGDFIDVIIHSKILTDFYLRKAYINDAKLLFEWVNDPMVRSNSLSTDKINWANHLEWFYNKLFNENTLIFIVIFEDEPIGQLRLDFVNNEWLIAYSVDRNNRGQGFGKKIIGRLIEMKKFSPLKAQVKADNIGSIKVFEKLGFKQNGITSGTSDIINFKYD